MEAGVEGRMFSWWKLVFFVVSVLAIASTVSCQNHGKSEPPKWSSVYSVNGLLELPYAEIAEPFSAFYDETVNKSRIDFYNTIVRTMQIGASGSTGYGIRYKIVPITTEEVLNQDTCFLINGTENATISIFNALPDLTGFQLISGPANDTQIWQKVEVIGSKKNTYTMHVDISKGHPVPKRYVILGYDSLFFTHYDKYYITYSNYETLPSIPPEKFNITAGFTCKEFLDTYRGHHTHHPITMNPLQEYINNDDSHIHEMFDSFKNRHSKQYDSDKEEESRKNIFRQNVRYIHSSNRAGKGYELGVNHLVDMKQDELDVLRGQFKAKGYNGALPFDESEYDLVNVPKQLDWRLYGAVTPVKDQAVCGSCWSFGVTGSIEGANFVKTGKLVSLSEQELVDCSWGEGNNGCDGGDDYLAYSWIMKHGIASTEDYGPYMGQDGLCGMANVTAAVNISGYVNITQNSAVSLTAALVKRGPISISIDASQKDFSFYSNGVYYNPDCGNEATALDHAVLLVGYGYMNGQPYWLVKNSWSTYWGNDGYILMAQKDNNCGVMTMPTHVLIS